MGYICLLCICFVALTSWTKMLLHVKVCFQGEHVVHSQNCVKTVFANILVQVAWFIIRSVFCSASAFIISLHTLEIGSLLF